MSVIKKGTLTCKKHRWYVKYQGFFRVVKEHGFPVDTQTIETEIPVKISEFDINAPFNASGIVSLIEGKGVEFTIENENTDMARAVLLDEKKIKMNSLVEKLKTESEEMHALFLPYELAKKFKEKGFDKPCFKGYFNYVGDKTEVLLLSPKPDIFGENYLFKNSIDFVQNENPNAITNKNCAAPLYQQAIDFLDSKGLFIESIIDGWGSDEKISKDICHRTFLWEVDKPKPKPYDDFGATSDRYKILAITMEHALNEIK